MSLQKFMQAPRMISIRWRIIGSMMCGALLTAALGIMAVAGMNRTALLWLTGYIVGASILFGWWIAGSIIMPLDRFRERFHDIAAGERDLTKRFPANTADEISTAARWFNLFMEGVHGMVTGIIGHASSVASGASRVDDTSCQIVRHAERIETEACSLATAAEQMAETSNDIARNCLATAENATKASDVAAEGAYVVMDTVNSMNEIAGRVREAAETVEELGNQSSRIGEIINTIEDIADQTNLLALNAAIEAARAGEQGRGFAVVADEVRALAERTTKATHQISEMIISIQRETERAVQFMKNGVNDVEKGIEGAARSSEVLAEIMDQISSVNTQVSQIATAAEEQSATTYEISLNISKIKDMAAEASASAHQAADAASGLTESADRLQTMAAYFAV